MLSLKRIIWKSNSGTLSSTGVCPYLKIIAANHALHRYTSQVIHIIDCIREIFIKFLLFFFFHFRALHTLVGNKVIIFNLINLPSGMEGVSVLHHEINFTAAHSMDPPGFEPGAPALQGRCYTGLSHRPILIMLRLVDRHTNKKWICLYKDFFTTNPTTTKTLKRDYQLSKFPPKKPTKPN